MGERIDCRQATEQLHDYLKREMTPELAEEIRAHLDRCKPCFNHARFEENYLRLLESCGRQRDGAKETVVAEGEFTFVALDQNDKPREIAAEEESNG